MEPWLRLLALAVYLSLGVFFARRWVTSPPKSLLRYPWGLRIATLFLVCWIGVFVLANLQNQISIFYFDPNDFPEDKGLSASVAYDDVGNNVHCLFFGWLAGPFCIALAKFIWWNDDAKTASQYTAP